LEKLTFKLRLEERKRRPGEKKERNGDNQQKKQPMGGWEESKRGCGW
jgi:hypothetical protein